MHQSRFVKHLYRISIYNNNIMRDLFTLVLYGQSAEWCVGSFYLIGHCTRIDRAGTGCIARTTRI